MLSPGLDIEAEEDNEEIEVLLIGLPVVVTPMEVGAGTDSVKEGIELLPNDGLRVELSASVADLEDGDTAGVVISELVEGLPDGKAVELDEGVLSSVVSV